MTPTDRVQYREATSADVAAMATCRSTDPSAGAADPRMGAYLEGRHHPQQALHPRTAFMATVGGVVAGYVAGHRTRRHGCDGEVQYLFVAPSHRRKGIASALLRLMAGWFRAQGASRVCVNVDPESAAAAPFYSSLGAIALDAHWCLWEDIEASLDAARGPVTIRRARSADAPALARLRHEFRARIGDPSEEESAFVDRCAEWMAQRLADGERWRAWVAVRPDRDVVGTVWVGSIEKMPNPTPEPEEHAYVTNVYVCPEARGEGIGTALLEAALAWCESRGIHAAILWSTRRSAPLYRRHGFAEPEAILERSFGEGPRR